MQMFRSCTALRTPQGLPCALRESHGCSSSHRRRASVLHRQRGGRQGATQRDDVEDKPEGVHEWDVTSNVISPSYRSTPWAAETNEQQKGSRSKGRILFVGECNVCRSVLAEAIMQQLLLQNGLQDDLECEAKGSRNYNLGDPPEEAAMTVAAERGLTLPADYAARVFNPEQDIVRFDMVVVMDKFTAADVLREVSSYDLINKAGNYSQKVRRLGDFHPRLCKSVTPDGQDIDDPLYGNYGGEEEEDSVRRAAQLIDESCHGLLQFLLELRVGAGTGGLAAALRGRVEGMEQIQWLVPPMLQGRVAKIGQPAR